MKLLQLALIGLPIAWMSGSLAAHDEGHGPKLSDVGKQGGIVAPVVDAKDASKGAQASLVYKAELVRSEDGTVRLFLYDKDMKKLDLTKFDKSAKAVLEVTAKKKASKEDFTLLAEADGFVGKAPVAKGKPYNIDVHLTEPNRTLLTAFDNLD